MKYHGSDKAEAQRDEYTKEGMPLRDSVGIAMDQAMSKVFANTKDMRDSFAGFGPGVMLGSKKEMTAKEFLKMMRERREVADAGATGGNQEGLLYVQENPPAE